jgi:hypothetical protein
MVDLYRSREDFRGPVTVAALTQHRAEFGEGRGFPELIAELPINAL